jgi:phage terminase small subunit
MALTKKQEDFCQNIVDGCTQLESYRRAYDAENMSDGAASGEAYKLMNNPKVARRIQQMRDQLAELLLFPRIERLQVLKDIGKGGEKDSDRINAIKVFSDMIGDNQPQKIEIEHSGSIESSNEEITREAKEIAARLNV